MATGRLTARGAKLQSIEVATVVGAAGLAHGSTFARDKAGRSIYCESGRAQCRRARAHEVAA